VSDMNGLKECFPVTSIPGGHWEALVGLWGGHSKEEHLRNKHKRMRKSFAHQKLLDCVTIQMQAISQMRVRGVL
jgi:hypothetical protein